MVIHGPGLEIRDPDLGTTDDPANRIGIYPGICPVVIGIEAHTQRFAQICAVHAGLAFGCLDDVVRLLHLP